VKGCNKQIDFVALTTCKTCNGTGAKPPSKPSTCNTCKGKGHQRISNGPFQFVTDCRTCGGQGHVIVNPCPTCRGTGTTRERRSISVTIPAGVDTGTNVRVANEGDVGERGSSPGHLFITIQVLPHETFKREGVDIHTNVPISFATAAMGGYVRVPTVDGEVEVQVPDGLHETMTIVYRVSQIF